MIIYLFALIGAFYICLVGNLLTHGNIGLGLVNSGILVFSILMLLRVFKKSITRFHPFFLVTLGAIPVFHFDPGNLVISLLLVLMLIVWMLGRQAIIICLIIFLWGNLLSGKIITWPNNLNKTRLISDVTSISDAITLHQFDALYIPYQLRRIIYNKQIYLQYFAQTVASFVNFKDLADVILLANLYPLVAGMRTFVKSASRSEILLILSFVGITVFCIGINRSPDKFNSLYFSSPILLYFLLLGIEKVRVKAYASLLTFTALLTVKGV